MTDNLEIIAAYTDAVFMFLSEYCFVSDFSVLKVCRIAENARIAER